MPQVRLMDMLLGGMGKDENTDKYAVAADNDDD